MKVTYDAGIELKQPQHELKKVKFMKSKDCVVYHLDKETHLNKAGNRITTCFIGSVQ